MSGAVVVDSRAAVAADQVHSPYHGPRSLYHVALLAWCGGVAVTSWISSDAFVWVSGLGFAVLAIIPFLRPLNGRLDAGEALYFFLLYYVLAMLLRGIGLLTFVDSPYVRVLGDSGSAHFVGLVGWTFFYSAIGLAALYAGYLSNAARWASRAVISWPAGPTAAWREGGIGLAALLLMAIGSVGFVLRARAFGGLEQLVSDLVSAGTSEALGRYWQIALSEFAVVGAQLLMLNLYLRRSRRKFLKILGIALIVAVPLYLTTSSKSLLLRLIVPPLLFHHFLLRPLSVTSLAMLFAGFGALFPLFYAYRAMGFGGVGEIPLYLETFEQPWMLLFNRSYGADSFMLILERTGEGLPLLWGASLADLGTFFVPRALWPDKPLPFGLVFPERFMPHVAWGGMTYVSPSLPGELFLNFHVVGVIVGFVLFGMLLRTSYEMARTRAPTALLVYTYVFLSAMHLAEGSIAAKIEGLLGGLAPALLVHLLLRRRERRALPPVTNARQASAV